MSQKLEKLENLLEETTGAMFMQSHLYDIIFTVLEDYGEGFVDWYVVHVVSLSNNKYGIWGIEKHLTWPEVIQEYRKYLSQQNQQS